MCSGKNNNRAKAREQVTTLSIHFTDDLGRKPSEVIDLDRSWIYAGVALAIKRMQFCSLSSQLLES